MAKQKYTWISVNHETSKRLQGAFKKVEQIEAQLVEAMSEAAAIKTAELVGAGELPADAAPLFSWRNPFTKALEWSIAVDEDGTLARKTMKAAHGGRTSI